jgi:hypothetical protein
LSPVRTKPATVGGAPRNIIEPVKGPEEIPAAPGDDVRLRLRERFSALRAELERLRFETDRRWEELLSRLSENPEEILPEELLRTPPDALSSRRGAISLCAVRRLDGANDQVEVLSRFLEECLGHASRAALLVERDGGLQVWKRAGFSGTSAPGSNLPEDAALQRVREGFPQALPEGNAISRAIGAEDAVEAVIFPFAVRESVSGAVYADALAGGRSAFDPEGIALLAWLAGLAVDRLAGRKLVPAPALRPIGGAAPARAAVTGGPLAPPPTDDRRDEARRFARLLASEIKLYNEGAVREGREHGNLYFRLREDIERGRRLYEERVPADVRGDEDYYYEELVDVLAGGRPEALGSRG